MSVERMRLVLLAVAVAGIAGMIGTSIADSGDGALVFGFVTAAAALALVSTTAVTNRGSARGADELAEDVEAGVEVLLAAGAEERAVRALVRAAVQLGRASSGA
jgi:hypothetical protein